MDSSGSSSRIPPEVLEAVISNAAVTQGIGEEEHKEFEALCETGGTKYLKKKKANFELCGYTVPNNTEKKKNKKLR